MQDVNTKLQMDLRGCNMAKRELDKHLHAITGEKANLYIQLIDEKVKFTSF